MPQLDTNLFMNSFSLIITFLLLFYLYLIIYLIPQIFKSLLSRKFFKLSYRERIIKSRFFLRYNRKKFYYYLIKIIKSR